MDLLAKNELIVKIDSVLDEIRPALESDGGGIEIVDVKDGVLFVELHGACHGCPSAAMTLKAGVERIVIDAFPDIISRVESV